MAAVGIEPPTSRSGVQHSTTEPPRSPWEKGKTMDFSETVIVYDSKLATDDRSDKKFLLTSILRPLGVVCPLPRGYIYVLKHEKIV